MRSAFQVFQFIASSWFIKILGYSACLQVDQNVTRHLDKVLAPDENKKPTFDFLVLHYLGLDHIGHLEGARSPKIKPKLIEMDEVVKKIYTAMQKWVSRFVVVKWYKFIPVNSA